VKIPSKQRESITTIKRDRSPTRRREGRYGGGGIVRQVGKGGECTESSHHGCGGARETPLIGRSARKGHVVMPVGRSREKKAKEGGRGPKERENSSGKNPERELKGLTNN